jgi:hypothetical protein
MENTARLFIIVIGFCFLIAFVVWIFVAASKTRVVLENTEEAVRVCGEGNVAWVRFVKIKYAICYYLLHC